jgi:hypothetical protein
MQMYDFSTLRPHMFVFSVRRVKKGQEFLLDYGDVRVRAPFQCRSMLLIACHAQEMFPAFQPAFMGTCLCWVLSC